MKNTVQLISGAERLCFLVWLFFDGARGTQRLVARHVERELEPDCFTHQTKDESLVRCRGGAAITVGFVQVMQGPWMANVFAGACSRPDAVAACMRTHNFRHCIKCWGGMIVCRCEGLVQIKGRPWLRMQGLHTISLASDSTIQWRLIGPIHYLL